MNSQCADVIQAVASVINLCIVVLFFVWDKKTLTRMNEKERKEYWYHETLINRGVQLVELCFDELEKIIINIDTLHNKCALTDQSARDNIRKISSTISTLKRKLDAYTRLFNSSLSRKVRDNLNDLEDYLTEGIEKMQKNELYAEDLLYKISTYKHSILRILYLYDISDSKV